MRPLTFRNIQIICTDAHADTHFECPCNDLKAKPGTHTLGPPRTRPSAYGCDEAHRALFPNAYRRTFPERGNKVLNLPHSLKSVGRADLKSALVDNLSRSCSSVKPEKSAVLLAIFCFDSAKM